MGGGSKAAATAAARDPRGAATRADASAAGSVGVLLSATTALPDTRSICALPSADVVPEGVRVGEPEPLRVRVAVGVAAWLPVTAWLPVAEPVALGVGACDAETELVGLSEAVAV